MKLTGLMVHEAFTKIHENTTPWFDLSVKARSDYEDVAGILYAELNPVWLSYDMSYAEGAYPVAAEDLPQLLQLIKQYATKGDYIRIYVKDEDFDEIGAGQFYYMQDGKFLQVIESHGAAIDLEKTLNEMEAKAQASA